jgi:hypothetical protein
MKLQTDRHHAPRSICLATQVDHNQTMIEQYSAAGCWHIVLWAVLVSILTTPQGTGNTATRSFSFVWKPALCTFSKLVWELGAMVWGKVRGSYSNTQLSKSSCSTWTRFMLIYYIQKNPSSGHLPNATKISLLFYRVGQTQLGSFWSLITNQCNNTRENGKVPFVVDRWQLTGTGYFFPAPQRRDPPSLLSYGYR